LAKLPELSKLTIREEFGDYPFNLTDEVKAGVNAERHSKSWPSLDLTLQDLLIMDPTSKDPRPMVTTVVRWDVDQGFMTF
jgi:hypothetical protein